MVDIYNNIQIDSTKNLVTINTPNQKKLYLVCKKNTHSLYNMMDYLINVFKFRCNQLKSIDDFTFNKNGKKLELLKDPIESHKKLGDFPILNLELTSNATDIVFPDVEYDPNKFAQTDNSTVIFVKNLVGKSIVINLNDMSKTTVYELMLDINAKEAIEPKQQRLIFCGHQMEPTKMLSDYKLTKHSIIHLVLRLRGGMYNEVSGRNGQYEPLEDILIDMSDYSS